MGREDIISKYTEKLTIKRESTASDKKLGSTQEKDSAEQAVYKEVLTALDEFYDSMETDETIPPDEMDAKIANLEKLLGDWKDQIAKNPDNQQNLETFEKIVSDIQADWAKLKPLAIKYDAKELELDHALEGDDLELMASLMEELENINNQIANL